MEEDKPGIVLNTFETRKYEARSLEFSAWSVPSKSHPSRNEDSMVYNGTEQFAAILDGLGGLEDGDKASKLGANVISKALSEAPINTISEDQLARFKTIFQEASQAISSELPGSGTTAIAVKIVGQEVGKLQALIGSIGDSRAYIFRNGQVKQINEEDNALATKGLNTDQVKELADKFRGVISRTEYLSLSKEERNLLDCTKGITAILGDKQVEPHIYVLDLEKGDILILETDGIVLTNKEKEEILQTNPTDISKALVEESKRKFSSKKPFHTYDDDTTVVTIKVV
jgi:PPM family protein phosphatase